MAVGTGYILPHLVYMFPLLYEILCTVLYFELYTKLYTLTHSIQVFGGYGIFCEKRSTPYILYIELNTTLFSVLYLVIYFKFKMYCIL